MGAKFLGDTPPATAVSPDEARVIARDVFGIDGVATPLGSNQETNLRIREGNTGVWITFLVIAALYVGVAVSLVLILRKMSARFRAGDAELDRGGPYGPREPVAVGVGADAGADS